MANFVQWFAMIGSIIAVTLLVKLMKGGIKAQIISGFVVSTIPMGIMQSTSTQTDYLTAFWLLCLALFVVRSNHENGPLNVIGAGVALGLAVLTKPTACFFAAPFVLWLFVIWFRRDMKNSWKTFLLVFLTAVLLNSGFFLRNVALFHAPFGPHDDYTQSEIHSPRNIASNIVKYFSLNLNTPSSAVNRLIYTAIADLHHLSKVDINDRRTSAFANYSVETYIPHEDLVGNPMHLLLIIICGLALFSKNISRGNKELLYYFSSVAAGFLLFFVFIKYQPWLNRLMLPVFLLFSPITGIAMKRIFSRAALILFLLILFFVAVPPLVFNIKKPLAIPPFVPDRYKYSLFTRSRQYFYFAAKPETYQCYKKIAETIKRRNYSQIGMEEFSKEYEYPLWIVLEGNGRKFRMEHVGVTNISRSIPADFTPSVIICIGSDPKISQKYAKKFKYREVIGYDSFGSLVMLYGQ
ncbi:MAG: glycosyltransferase family 39 protein [Candidatus Saganbacteria bacterium]|nr:glycosyltransferase family 39 protein [Candidatus Saganbacteria bacterium]